jgi:L-fuconolactonase
MDELCGRRHPADRDDLMRMIDAHQHYWTIDAPGHEWPTAALPTIHRDFAPADLDPARARCGIAGTILVQSQPNAADTARMLTLSERTPSVLGVIGWIAFDAPDAPAQIAALARHPKLRGLRPMLQDLPPQWILDPAKAPALHAMAAHGLVFDALVRPDHLGALATLAERHPMLSIVIDHGAKPDIAGTGLQPWAADLARVAEHRNVACKLSGLVTEATADWTLHDLAPVVATVLAAFGADRVLWGSDWPVLLLRSTYDEWLASARALVDPQDHAAVFCDTAQRIYGVAHQAKAHADDPDRLNYAD